MQEKTVWTGSPAQIINSGSYTFCVLFCWLVIPAMIGLWQYLVLRATRYELTTQRLRLRTGVLNKKTNDLELYRVKDFSIEQPLSLRVFSLANIVIVTSDKTNPKIILRAVPDAEALLDTIREHVEKMRFGRVREVDMG